MHQTRIALSCAMSTELSSRLVHPLARTPASSLQTPLAPDLPLLGSHDASLLTSFVWMVRCHRRLLSYHNPPRTASRSRPEVASVNVHLPHLVLLGRRHHRARGVYHFMLPHWMRPRLLYLNIW